MVPLKSLFREYVESRPFHSLVNVSGYLDEHTLLTKSGDILCMLSLGGADAESLEPTELGRVAARLTSAFNLFDESFTVNSVWRKRANPVIEAESHTRPVVRAALSNRHAYLERRGAELASYRTDLIITRRPEWGNLKTPRIASLRNFRRSYSANAQAEVLRQQLEKAKELLHRTTRGFIEQIGDLFDVRVLGRNDSFALLRELLNPDRERAAAVKLKYPHHVDFQAVGSELTVHRKYLWVDGTFVAVLTVKEPPAHTFAHMLCQLTRVSADVTVVSEWTPVHAGRAVSTIRSKRRHFHNTKSGLTAQMRSERPYEREMLFDDSKEALVADLGRCLEEIEMKGTQIGEYSLTFLVQAKTLEAVQKASAEVARIIGAHDGALTHESYNILNAYLAALPGGQPFNLRKLLLTNRNHVDLGLWWAPSEGAKRNAFLDAPSLLTLETEEQSLFHFNLHVKDVGHGFVLGMTGAGKSFFLNGLVTHAQKCDPFTVILDVGGSYRWLTRAMGGSYISLRADALPFRINVFALPQTPANRQFQFDFVGGLIQSGSYSMNDADKRNLWEAIDALSFLDRDQQRLGTLVTTLPSHLGRLLLPWTEGEQYGAYFDHVEDNVSFADFQCLDFEGMERLGIARDFLLLYFLHRVNEHVTDPTRSTRFKLCVIDEAWLLSANPAIRALIETALRTWRKKNAAMILATQTLSDLTEAATLRPILDNCPTKILLANPTLDAGLYGEVLQLTPSEQERIRTLIPKKQFLLKQDGISKVLNFNVDPRSYWLFTTNPFEAKRREEALATGSLDAALDFLAGGSR